jgi:hypothetical protein
MGIFWTGFDHQNLANRVCMATRHRTNPTIVLEAVGEGTILAAHVSPTLSPRLSLFSDHLRTVLAVKGSLRRVQQRRALDGSGPF